MIEHPNSRPHGADLPVPAPVTVLERKIDYFSASSIARVRKRYRSEARFKMLGLLAVAIAALFVAFLLVDIVIKGAPAFREHRVVLSLQLDPAVIDPKGTRDLAEIRAADYAAITRESLRSLFPNVTERRARRLLDGLLSNGAPDDVRAAVMANPAMIGQELRIALPLSANADLFFKGVGTPVLRTSGMGPLGVSIEGKDIILTAKENGFRPALVEIKARNGKMADVLQLELTRLTASTGSSAALDTKRTEVTAKIAELRARAGNIEATEMLDATLPSVFVSVNGGLIRLTELTPGRAKGIELLSFSSKESADSNAWQLLSLATPESNRRISDVEIAWLEALKAKGAIENGFAWRFFTNGDSREPELAGIRGALTGSALTLLVTLVLCLPIGVGAAVYLEEFAPKNRLTDILEVNINNLAAVPSIVFGLLGLAMFLNFFNLPRSAPLVGGLVLALLVMPTIIIAARAAIRAVPPSIKEAALGVGASHQQAVFHHVLPLAMPGIMTGTVIGMAHALGETAPLLMIGMVAFIVEVPGSILDAATVLPVQIYLWSDLPELAFQAKTAAAIMVLLAFLFLMNGLAILLRRRFERRW